MNTIDICSQLRETTPALYKCFPAPVTGIQIRTPLMLPDGDTIDVFVVEDSSGLMVTDFGCALGWLRTQSIRGQLTPRQRFLLDDVCMTLEIEYDRGQLRSGPVGMDELGEAVQRVAQAVVRVSDLWFTFRTQAWESLADEIDAWLSERDISFERRARTTGRSGRTWPVDYKTSVLTHTSFVFLLATGSRGAVHSITNRVFTGCHDINASIDGSGDRKLVSLFDDTVDVWRSEDFTLLESVSEIARWSSPEEFEEILISPSSLAH